MRDTAQVFSGVDAYISPAGNFRSLGITNLTGHPSLVAPCGFGADQMRGSIRHHTTCGDRNGPRRCHRGGDREDLAATGGRVTSSHRACPGSGDRGDLGRSLHPRQSRQGTLRRKTVSHNPPRVKHGVAAVLPLASHFGPSADSPKSPFANRPPILSS